MQEVPEWQLEGELSVHHAEQLWHELQAMLRESAGQIRIDLSGVTAIDGTAAALLADTWREFHRRGEVATLVGAAPAVAEMLRMHGTAVHPPVHLEGTVRRGTLDELGSFCLRALQNVEEIFDFLGGACVALAGSLRRPSSVHWSSVGRVMERAGADGLPIVALITFLVGLIMGFQAAIQLAQVGANIFVADLVGISITRELGPLMTAILVAGRSGSAFSAEIATMKVGEEIDALRTLGLCPYRFLVFPRIVALLFVMPILTLLADLVGIGGGMVVAVTGLDLSASAYLARTQEVLGVWDVGSGVIKSVVFAATIGLISCQCGSATRGGAEGVGRATTTSVVTILFHLVLIDALFTVVFHACGL